MDLRETRQVEMTFHTKGIRYMVWTAYRRKVASLNSDQIGTLMPGAQYREQVGVAGWKSRWRVRLSHGDGIPQIKFRNE